MRNDNYISFRGRMVVGGRMVVLYSNKMYDAKDSYVGLPTPRISNLSLALVGGGIDRPPHGFSFITRVNASDRDETFSTIALVN